MSAIKLGHKLYYYYLVMMDMTTSNQTNDMDISIKMWILPSWAYPLYGGYSQRYYGHIHLLCGHIQGGHSHIRWEYPHGYVQMVWILPWICPF